MQRKLAPYLLALPAWVWLALFFVVPLIGMASLSLASGNVMDGFTQTFSVGNYVTAVDTYSEQLIRSFVYGACATVICVVIGYPVAYWIAFSGGAHKGTYLLLLLLPFFVSFVLRTISWRFALSDNGVILGPLKSIGLLPAEFGVLNTAPAVILGLAYNFLPFMVLPIYAVLERMDHRLVEAAYDLYANRVQVFLKVVLPVSLPGVFAGGLLTFIPTTADYVNASVLGGTHNTMIGSIIQTQYLVNAAYPIAAAITFILMALLLAGIFSYARALGTERVMEVQAK
jgi:spermidine/putrescine transport system permease protein